MKMARHYLEQIEGVWIYPVIGLILFFLFAIFVGIWVIRMKKDYIHEVSHLPLDDENVDTVENQHHVKDKSS